MHWVLDVAFGEDACRAWSGHAARNLLRQDTSRKESIATKRCTTALDDTYLAAILTGLAPQHTSGDC